MEENMENLAEVVNDTVVPAVKKHSAAIKAGLTAAGGFVMGSITTIVAARAPAVQAGVRAFEAERRKRKAAKEADNLPPDN